MTNREIQAIREWNLQVIRDLRTPRLVNLKDGTQAIEKPDLEDWKIATGYIAVLATEIERLQSVAGG